MSLEWAGSEAKAGGEGVEGSVGVGGWSARRLILGLGAARHLRRRPAGWVACGRSKTSSGLRLNDQRVLGHGGVVIGEDDRVGRGDAHASPDRGQLAWDLAGSQERVSERNEEMGRRRVSSRLGQTVDIIRSRGGGTDWNWGPGRPPVCRYA